MILPTKHVRPQRALLGVGAEILETLRRPMTVSALWDRVRKNRAATPAAPISYAWFVLSLDFLYLIEAVELRDGILARARP